MAFVSYPTAKRNPALLKRARALGLNEPELTARIKAEIAGNHTWARRAPNVTNNAGDATMQVDVSAAITTNFALS
jgi:hypothetical protein